MPAQKCLIPFPCLYLLFLFHSGLVDLSSRSATHGGSLLTTFHGQSEPPGNLPIGNFSSCLLPVFLLNSFCPCIPRASSVTVNPSTLLKSLNPLSPLVSLPPLGLFPLRLWLCYTTVHYILKRRTTTARCRK